MPQAQWPPPLLVDLLRISCSLKHRSIRLLKSGLPGKRAMLSLNQLLLQPLDLDEIRSFEDSGYLFFLYELAYQLDLFVESDGHLQPSPSALHELLTASQDAQRDALHQAYSRMILWNEFQQLEHLRRLGEEQSTLAPGQLMQARRAVLGLVQELPADPIALPELLAFAQAQHPDLLGLAPASGVEYLGLLLQEGLETPVALQYPRDWALVEGAFLAQMMQQALSWLGTVQQHPDDSFSYVPALASPPPEACGLIVQSNLDILVFPGTGQLALMAQLESFCRPLDGEQILRYHIDKKRFFQTLQKGHRLSSMLDPLESHSRTPLPENVLHLMRSWYQQSNQIVVSKQGHILEVEDASEMAGLRERWPEDLPFTPLGPTSLFVPAYAEERLRRWLSSRPTQQIDYLRDPPQSLKLDAHLKVELEPPHDLFVHPFLERIAEPQEGGSYQITQEKLLAAMEQGISFEDILEFLETRARVFSSTARLRLEAFAGQLGRVSTEQVTLLRTEAEEILERLLHEGGMAPFLQRLGPTSALLVESLLPEAEALLRSFSLPTPEQEPPPKEEEEP